MDRFLYDSGLRHERVKMRTKRVIITFMAIVRDGSRAALDPSLIVFFVKF